MRSPGHYAVFGLALVLTAVSASFCAAVEPVFIRGHLVTPRHVVFGRIESLRGEVAVVNLGYTHGLRTTESLLVVRRVDDELIPIAGLTVVATEADHSRTQIEGPFRVQLDDFVLIHASHLTLWGGTPRLDRMAREQAVRRQSGNGYSTMNTDAELIEEVGRDDDYQGKQYQGVKLETIRKEAIDKAGPLKSQIGAVAPLQVLDPAQADAEDAKVQETDAAILELSYFVELAKSPAMMIPRIATSRLQTLRPLGTQLEVDENSAPLFRSNLMTWVRKALAVRD